MLIGSAFRSRLQVVILHAAFFSSIDNTSLTCLGHMAQAALHHSTSMHHGMREFTKSTIVALGIQ